MTPPIPSEDAMIAPSADALYLAILFASFIFLVVVRSVYKELHADHETGAADNK